MDYRDVECGDATCIELAYDIVHRATVRRLCMMKLPVAVAGWSAWSPGYPPCVPGGAW
jgi:hypothetical protein